VALYENQEGLDDDEELDVAARHAMIIFGSPQAYQDQRLQKLTHRQIYVTAPAAPLYLCWSERPITFDRADHPDWVIEVGRFPLVVSAIIETVRMILMDGSSGINILYKDAFDKLGVDIRKLHAS
jgi:hypothetical protein